MKRKSIELDPENPIANISEMNFSARDGDQESEIFGELRIGTHELAFEGATYFIGITTATLVASLEGISFKIGERVGDINTISARQSSTSKFEKGEVITAMISGNPVGIGAELSLGGDVRRSSQSENQGEHQALGIRALSNGRWRIENARAPGKYIESTILRGETICRVTHKESSNRWRLELSLRTNRTDFEVSTKELRMRLGTKNREKIIGILATKAIRENGRSLQDGAALTLSSSSIEWEWSGDDSA